MSLDPRPADRAFPPPLPERRSTPPAARGRYLDALQLAWRQARAQGDPADPRLALAIAAFAHDGRARAVPVTVLLRALDTIVHPWAGGDGTLDFGGVREWAGTLLIGCYYGVD